MKSIYSGEYQKLVEKLKQARLSAGLTQKEVAQKLGKPQSFVSKVEAGERRLDIIELNKLSRMYKKSINFFMENL
ncbi:MAG: helix-turn-helix transcriptional regulator [Patescibacteria group bacterium]